MRKISPQGVKDDFNDQLGKVNTFYQSGMQNFTLADHQYTFAEHIILTVAVVWEGFLNDLFIAYVNGNPSRFETHFSDAIAKHIGTRKELERAYNSYGSIRFPRHLKKAEIIGLADKNGYNITFSRYNEIEKKAKDWLISADARRFQSRSIKEKATINALIAIRNRVVHRSQKSFVEMNKALCEVDLQNTGLERHTNKIRRVGAYLKATPGGQNTRLSIIISTLVRIGQAL